MTCTSCVSVCDGRSTFSADMYLGIPSAKDITDGLKRFAPQMYGGLYDLCIGAFGPEYASGALQVRFEFHRSGNGKIFLTATEESDWFDAPHTKVASYAKLYLKTEPALLDSFITQFSSVAEGSGSEATLNCI